MISEDYRSQAIELAKGLQATKMSLGWSKEEVLELNELL